MTKKRCPECLSDTGIRKIMYGMPMEEPDPAIYTIGGCCISDDMPEYECIECGWREFNSNRTETLLEDRKKTYILFNCGVPK